jgi:(p)ppGpp synthase/HD superfamily hydrolase
MKSTKSLEKYTSTIEYVQKAHEGQFRRFSMAPYFTHPVRVATLVMKYKQSHSIDDLVVAALLHDVVEDTSITIQDIQNQFGLQVGQLVNELTTDKIKAQAEGKAKYLSDKMVQMSSWGLVLKLCDRLDNVMDFIYASKEFVDKYSQETTQILDALKTERYLLSGTHNKIILTIEQAMEFGAKEVRYGRAESMGNGAES